MLENLLIGQTSEPSDPYFENVTLLLHGDGTNGGQNNTFIDSSTNNFTITRNGNTTQGSFSPYGDLWSNYFDGTGDYLTAPSTTLSSNFTFEGWMYQTGSDFRPFGIGDHNTGQNGLGVYVSSTFQTTINGTSVNSATGTFGNKWIHFAVVRNGSTVTTYLDGVSVSTLTSSTSITGTIYIGAARYNGVTYATNSGYISNVRLVSSAVYTTNFTPPTAPLTAITNTSLLTCQSNRFVDNSSNNFTITRNGDVSVQRFSPFSPTDAYSAATIGGSAYFDGTGDYLDFPSNAAFGLGTGDFTIECFVCLSAYPSLAGVLVDLRGGTDPATKPCLEYGSTGTINYRVSGANRISGGTLQIGKWAHVALCRSSGVTKLYLDGVQVGSNYTDSNDYGSTSRARIGADDDGSIDVYVNGFVSNVRIVKGTAVYTGAFTPPTAPLTAITNTSLLLNFTNGAIFDNAMMNDLETVGNAQIDTTVKKFGTGSLKFDGTGDYLIAPSNPAFAFGTSDFTIEFWVYVSGTSAGQILFDQRTSASQIVPTVYIETNAIYYFVNGSSRISTGFTTTNSWVHVAVSRSGTSTKLFIGGTQAGSTYTDSNNYIQNPVYIGARWDANSALSGYIDDLRITKGVARYTANFTPPSAPFPNK